jgi:hypothetical protein
MKRLGRAAADLLVLVALVWTAYEEARHLVLTFGDGVPAGIVDYIDILVTVTLLGFALYELAHLAGITARLDRFILLHEAWLAFLLAALAWGIYRDVIHFHHRYLGADGSLPLDDEVDIVAAVVLALALLKIGHHMLGALKGLHSLAKGRTRVTGAGPD